MTVYQNAEGELSYAQHEDSIALAETYPVSGMVAIQLSIPAADAPLRVRPLALTHDQSVAETAVDIVARRLRVPNDHHPETEV